MAPKNPIGVPFNELSEVDSTNNYAMRQVQAHLADHGSTWFAWYQNAGKGQRGKQWKAQRGLNIMMSAVIEPEIINVHNQFLLNVFSALACFDLFKKYSTGTLIKWPNDIYWDDRKAGGILIENILRGKQSKFCIVGMGLNINQTLFPENLPNAVSLKQITGKTYDVMAMAKELCNHLDARWNQLYDGEHKELMEEYNAVLYKAGETVQLKKADIAFEAKLIRVNEAGQLMIEKNQQLEMLSAPVEWVAFQPK